MRLPRNLTGNQLPGSAKYASNVSVRYSMPVRQYIASLYEHNIAKVLLARAIGNAEQLAKQYLADNGDTTTLPNVNQNPAMPSPNTTPAPAPSPQAAETPRP